MARSGSASWRPRRSARIARSRPVDILRQPSRLGLLQEADEPVCKLNLNQDSTGITLARFVSLPDSAYLFDVLPPRYSISEATKCIILESDDSIQKASPCSRWPVEWESWIYEPKCKVTSPKLRGFEWTSDEQTDETAGSGRNWPTQWLLTSRQWTGG